MAQHQTSQKILCSFALVAVVFGASAATTYAKDADHADGAKTSARLDTFAAADGDTYFALSLTPTAAAPADRPTDIAILFDTSASQNGEYREKGLAALESMLLALPSDDRVQLLAVDLDIQAFTKDFVSPQGDEIRAAIGQLVHRVPLGATDIQRALNAAVDLFSASDNPRAVVYIGDGLSTANLVSTKDLRALVDRLAAERVAVSCYAVGPQVEIPLLAAFANQTGGMGIVEQIDVSGEEVGRFLADAATNPVVWPTNVQLDDSISAAYPTKFPPLRYDRDTIVIGKGSLATSVAVRVDGVVAGEKWTCSWNVTPSESTPDNSYLVKLVNDASRNGGVALASVGSVGLNEMRLAALARVDELVKLGRQAMASGVYEQALALAEEALSIDPENPQAKTIKNAAIRSQNTSTKTATNKSTPAKKIGFRKTNKSVFRLAAYQQDEEATPADDVAEVPPPPAAGDLLTEVERERRLLRDLLTTEVRNTINDARQRLTTDPVGATSMLKLSLEQVRQATELDPAIRDQLSQQIERALREAARQEVINTNRQITAQAIAAQARQREQMTRDLLNEEQKVDQLIARFNSLLDEERYRDAENVATLAAEIKPSVPALTGAVLHARLVGNFQDAYALNVARHNGFLNTLATVDVSHVPTPDEPPILYPEAETWKALTARREKWKVTDLARRSPAEEKIERALDETTSIDALEEPLSDVIQQLEALHGIDIELDTSELEAAGVTSDTLVSRSLRGVSLRSALRLILKDFDLTYLITDDVLLITTQTEADSRVLTKVYPVGDLVIPVSPQSLMGGGMGGGMMGGGMMGGGMMGGMGGGMMGGMGGGMMGGMGGGMGRMGGGMFAVPDDLRLSSKSSDAGSAPKAAAAPSKETAKAAPTPRATKPQVAAAKPKAISPPEGADRDQAWNAFFASNEVSPADVRETVRILTEQRQFDEVIAVIHGALRNQQSQAWMYEALGLALQLDNRPATDLERALMSAVDFNASPNEMIYLAQYMARAGLEERALKLYHQVSQLAPADPTAFVHGLQLAKRMDNLEGIRWTTVGVLGQAWPADQDAIWHEAHRLALATLEQLKAENRLDEAAAYEAEVKDAIQRDCVVVVSWTGDADVDLAVEEPTGAVCTLRNPRTASGGAMLGDTFSRLDQNAAQAMQEVYVCPKGFDGTYRLLVRKVWGEVTAGKVTVEVYTHYGSENGTSIRRQIPLDRDALITFNLENGRRDEPLEEAQVATAIANQLQIGQHVLAQQIGTSGGAIDPAALASMLSARDSGGAPFTPFFARGAVGYRPDITVLPEGAMLSAVAVISADRRYVRITAMPFFSSIGDVSTFNFATGDTGSSPRGGGGGFGGGLGGGFGGF